MTLRGGTMIGLGFDETARASRNALLATKVAKVLNRLQTDPTVSPVQKATLSRGADLLAAIAGGSLLVEGGTPRSGVSPSEDGLRAFSHALTALQQLSRLQDHAAFTDLFLRYRDDLQALSEGTAHKRDEVPLLIGFFRVLSDLFEGDLVRNSLPERFGNPTSKLA